MEWYTQSLYDDLMMGVHHRPQYRVTDATRRRIRREVAKYLRRWCIPRDERADVAEQMYQERLAIQEHEVRRKNDWAKTYCTVQREYLWHGSVWVQAYEQACREAIQKFRLRITVTVNAASAIAQYLALPAAKRRTRAKRRSGRMAGIVEDFIQTRAIELLWAMIAHGAVCGPYTRRTRAAIAEERAEKETFKQECAAERQRQREYSQLMRARVMAREHGQPIPRSLNTIGKCRRPLTEGQRAAKRVYDQQRNANPEARERRRLRQSGSAYGQRRKELQRMRVDESQFEAMVCEDPFWNFMYPLHAGDPFE